jgi:hypothetical protein
MAVCLTLLLALSMTARAQMPATAEPAIPEKTGKSLEAFRVEDTHTLRIDGRLDDEAWKVAATIDDFVQMEPQNMSAPGERTVVQVAYDKRYVYVGVRCYMSDPATIRSSLGRRDNIPASDRIYLSFDPRHDHQTGYVYMLNVSGVQGDFTLFDDTQNSFDYDGVWEAATHVDRNGWTAEVRIPFSQMRFDTPDGESATWGFNVERHIAGTGEEAWWVPTPRGVTGRVSRFGHLVFGERLAPPRRIELLPFTLASVEHHTTDADSAGLNGGLDIRIGLGASTLSATINPDFGQVEADPAVLNLSVFETFFPEKRPFFLEDSRIFVLPYGQMPSFYSRRIGQVPGRLALHDGEALVSKPRQTTILGAAKLTGKSSGWTYGVLGAVTSREYAVVDVTTVDDDRNETITRNGNRLVEPAALYTVGRIQRDLGGSNVGLISTAVVREKDRDAFTGGPDFNIRWDRNRFTLNGHWLVTRAPIDAVMRTDHGGVVNLNFEAKHLAAYLHADHFGRNFRNADIGFLRSRADKNDVSGTVEAIQPDPWKMFRRISGHVGTQHQWTDNRLVFGRVVFGGFNANLRNYWRVFGGADHLFDRFDDLDTRGGPVIARPSGDSYYLGVYSDSRKKWRGSVFTSGKRDAAGGWERSVEPGVSMQVADRLQAEVSVNYQLGRDAAQWIQNEDLDGDGADENIYGRLKRHVVNVTGRATYSFTRDLTFEAYLQPFVAAGDYTDIRRLALPRSYSFAPVTIGNDPDFSDKSLRGTIVMRWEYLRGSTLFLVWNMATNDDTRPGQFSPLRDLGAGFGAPGSHAFVAKLSYWFAP